MVKKEYLFSLIKSLTKSEKRYFKLFASVNNNDANYIKLFDAIDEQNKYDEKEIKKKFQNENFIKQLHVTKNYLNKLILKSLRNFHSKISKDAELKDLLREIEILYKKELFQQCYYLIEKAEVLANQFEINTSLIEIFDWKRKVLLATGDSIKKKVNLSEVVNKQKDSVNKINNLYEYWEVTLNIYKYFSSGSKGFSDLMKSKLFKEKNYANSLNAIVLKHHIIYMKSIFTNNNDEALKQLNILIDLLEKYPDRINDDPHSYITTLNNKIGLLLSTNKYKSIPSLLYKIRNVPTKYNLKDKSKVTFKLLLRSYNVELEMYRDTENFKKGIELIEEIKMFISENENWISTNYKVLYFYQFAYIKFVNGDTFEALKWVNEIFNNCKGNSREDIESYAHFLNLIIHYELGNTIVLRYAVEAARRFLKKKKKLEIFEKTLLKYFSKLSTEEKKQHKEIFNKMNSEIFLGIPENVKANILDYLNFERWIEGKI